MNTTTNPVTTPATIAATGTPPAASKARAFTFGEPQPVLETHGIWDYVECYSNGRWYEPPVPFGGLAKSYRANPHHESAINFKCEMLTRAFIPHELLNKSTFRALVLDYLVFGNAHLEKRLSHTGRVIQLKHALAKYVRVADNLSDYVFLKNWVDIHTFAPGSICHLKRPDINQEVYGLPDYLSALQSVWLNEAATLFRRKYYLNGSHAGYILYLNDENIEEDDVNAIEEAMKNSKGPGNFKNLFLYAPAGKKDGVQLIPVGEVTAKDEFSGVKNISRDDVLVAHRVPPQLLGIVPVNSGGFGDITKASMIFIYNVILPLQDAFRAINEDIGLEVVRFMEPQDLLPQAGVSASAAALAALKEAMAGG